MPKPELSIIFGAKPKGGMGSESSDSLSELPPDFAECADRVFDAAKKGDRAQFGQALFDAIECHANPAPEDDMEDEPMEDEA